MKTRMNFFERLRAFLDRPDECWIWEGAKVNGYGVCGRSVNGKPKRFYCHDLTYELWHGPKPAGLHIDHLCRNRACFNPAHLEAVTQQENIRRGHAGFANSAKTHCPKGHPYDAVNTAVRHKKNGGINRICRTCHRAESRRRKERAHADHG